MTNRDKVAMILTTYGISLETGLNFYDEMVADACRYNVMIDAEEDVAIWGNSYTDGEGRERVNLTFWINYRNTFCKNYTLAGAIALNDENLEITDEDEKTAFLDFFRLCIALGDAVTTPILPERLRYIFTLAALTDYMDCETYEIDEQTKISVSTSARPVL